jgi:hypothetical protein
VRHEDEPSASSIYDQSDTTGTIMKVLSAALPYCVHACYGIVFV